MESGSIAAGTYKVSSGKDDYELTRFHVGLRTWLGREAVHAVDVVIHFEKPNYVGSGLASVWDISLWRMSAFRTGVFFSLEYPSSGPVIYIEDDGYADTGFFFGLYFTKSFDFFGRPYRSKRI